MALTPYGKEKDPLWGDRFPAWEGKIPLYGKAVTIDGKPRSPFGKANSLFGMFGSLFGQGSSLNGNAVLSQEREEDPALNSVDRHYRLSKAAYEKIRNRDIDRFPTEKDFVSEAVLSYEDRIKNTEIMAEVRELAKKIDRITIAMGW